MTLVAGIGQPLGGDDAVGLAVAERLRTEGVPCLSLTGGAALADALVGAGRAVIIDAVVGGWPPGTVVHLGPEELAGARGAAAVSSHGLRVTDAVALARALGGPEEVHLVGIAIDPGAISGGPGRGLGRPGSVRCALGAAGEAALSAEVAAAIGEAAARVRALLVAALGPGGDGGR